MTLGATGQDQSQSDPDQFCFSARPCGVPGYKLLKRLRHGDAEVWRAEGPGGFPAALWFTLPTAGTAPAVLEGLEVLRRIRHPNLLAAFGSWEVGPKLVLATELPDRTLWDRFVEARAAGGPGIPRDELIDHLAEAARGVDHFLDPGRSEDGSPPGPGAVVPHGDVSPQTVLLIGGGVKVANVGPARWAVAQSGGGADAYAAPERFAGLAFAQTDQYSLAVTYCQMRGGGLPFPGEGPAAMASHLLMDPDLGALPDEERPAVARALSKDAGDRWPSCRAFIEALRADVVAADARRAAFAGVAEAVGPAPARVTDRPPQAQGVVIVKPPAARRALPAALVSATILGVLWVSGAWSRMTSTARIAPAPAPWPDAAAGRLVALGAEPVAPVPAPEPVTAHAPAPPPAAAPVWHDKPSLRRLSSVEAASATATVPEPATDRASDEDDEPLDPAPAPPSRPESRQELVVTRPAPVAPPSPRPAPPALEGPRVPAETRADPPGLAQAFPAETVKADPAPVVAKAADAIERSKDEPTKPKPKADPALARVEAKATPHAATPARNEPRSKPAAERAPGKDSAAPAPRPRTTSVVARRKPSSRFDGEKVPPPPTPASRSHEALAEPVPLPGPASASASGNQKPLRTRTRPEPVSPPLPPPTTVNSVFSPAASAPAGAEAPAASPRIDAPPSAVATASPWVRETPEQVASLGMPLPVPKTPALSTPAAESSAQAVLPVANQAAQAVASSPTVIAWADQLAGQAVAFEQVFSTTARTTPQAGAFLADARVLRSAAAGLSRATAAGDSYGASLAYRDINIAWRRMADRAGRISPNRVGPNIQQIWSMGGTVGQIGRTMP